MRIGKQIIDNMLTDELTIMCLWTATKGTSLIKNGNHGTLLIKNNHIELEGLDTSDDYILYVEGHHLIPIRLQDEFEYTIDFADNIIPLCPNCHRKIHYGIKQDRNRMIEKFYEKRIESIEQHGIEISIDKLEKCYSLAF